ncbi:hypothetical protein JTE90_013812 [Oedothorax gibbosus]|uniref:Uncharacterized protein n=1 Tax=Oedothorax gibbosus TaxID=931172 RepID=A0AAV6VIG2_9ARAC|nr:hypothetical protein JTE90_013812 [Oedothorax gibbosus]
MRSEKEEKNTDIRNDPQKFRPESVTWNRFSNSRSDGRKGNQNEKALPGRSITSQERCVAATMTAKTNQEATSLLEKTWKSLRRRR